MVFHSSDCLFLPCLSSVVSLASFWGVRSGSDSILLSKATCDMEVAVRQCNIIDCKNHASFPGQHISASFAQVHVACQLPGTCCSIFHDCRTNPNGPNTQTHTPLTHSHTCNHLQSDCTETILSMLQRQLQGLELSGPRSHLQLSMDKPAKLRPFDLATRQCKSLSKFCRIT